MERWSRRQRTEGQEATLFLRGGTVLTLDSASTVLSGADVLVENGRIAAIGTALGVPNEARVLDVSDCLLLPGLIQGHIHLGQTFFRGLAEGRRLLPWLKERIWPLEAAHDDESAYWCGLLGAAECLLGGTTTIQDIGLGPGARGLLQAIEDARLRAFAGLCLMDEGEGLPGKLAGDTDKVLRETEDLGRLFDGALRGRLSYTLNPRFILSCSDGLWRELPTLAADRRWPVHTHALEQDEETERVRSLKSGRDDIEYFAEEGILGTDLRIAHGVCLTPDHLKQVDGARFSVVHCPSANLKLGSGVADLVALRRADIPVGVGADGAPCNNDLDLFEEMRLAALLQKLRHGPDAFSGLDALRMATSEGARALGIGDETGSLEAGKAADIVVLGTERPELLETPHADLHDMVAFGASRASVRHVLVAGEILVEEGQLTHLELATIRRNAKRCLDEVIERSGLSF